MSKNLEARNNTMGSEDQAQKVKKQKTSFVDNSHMFQIQVPLELRGTINDRGYTEYVLNSSQTRVDGLDYIRLLIAC